MKKMHPAQRRQNIINAAIEEAEEIGYTRIHRDSIALRATCAPSTVTHYFGDMRTLTEQVLEEAITNRNLTIIAQGLAMRDPIVEGIPNELKASALARLLQLHAVA